MKPADDHHAGRRAREVYRYFRQSARIDEPLAVNIDGSPIPASHLQRSPSGSSASRGSWTPSVSERMPDALALGTANATLNSFAQLIALQLNMDRVFISVSDRDSQFIIAQAAKSKKSNSKSGSLSEGFYDGCPTLDVNLWKPCQDTIALSQSNKEQEEYNFIVSRDMTQDAQYKDLPFVKGDPNFRFYAGTPLTTDNNINMGCLFVLDTKPHADFSDSDKEMMGTMGMLIMNYLKVSRQASEGRRAARLSRGLNLFIDSKSSFGESFDDSDTHDTHRQQNTPPSSKTRENNHLVVNDNSPSRRSRSRDSDCSSIASDNRGTQSMASSFDSSVKPRFPGLQSRKRQDSDEEKGNAWTFQRAANLIRESLELEGDSGVAFIEAGSDPELDYETGSDTASSAKARKPASTLSVSTGENSFGLETSPSRYPVSKIDEVFLQGLLNRYPQGKIWSFHRDGMFSSSESEDMPRESRSRTRNRSPKSKRPRKWKTLENTMLNRLFPGATQVIFVPLWNTANSRWFGGCFCWNNIENVVLDPEVELSSVLGFGSSIMAECNRVEAHISNRQKEDFLGSVSHELRSPLHGVLAAAELLQGTNFDEFQGSLLETINACGRTLLDTMNQVLDYTKLVSLEKDLRHLKRKMATNVDIKSLKRSAGHLDTYTSTDLALLSEEVVDGVCLGHSYSQRPAASLDTTVAHLTHVKSTDLDIPELHVDVTLDIAQHDWNYHMPPGAFRRIIMNLLSNAVKYTDSGSVSVCLEAKEAPENRFLQNNAREDLIVLTVSDTGRGMSADFQRGRLFVPFSQESSLNEGTGLGLSIVRSLVKSLSGTISVDSRSGEGTSIKVAIPLAHHDPEEFCSISGALPSPPQEDTDSSTNEIRLLRDTSLGKKVAILGVEPDDAPKHPVWGTISQYLVDWYGIELVSPSSGTSIDVILADKPPLETEKQSFADPNQAVLVVSSKYVGHDIIRAEWAPFSKMVNIISRPCGPHKLARFLQKCFDQEFSPSNSEPPVPSLPDPERPSNPVEDTPSVERPAADDDKTPTPDNNPPPDTSPLPSLPAQVSPLPPASAENTETPEEPRKPRVLVVEDNKINLNLMLAFLKKRKLVTLDSAENGKLAVDAVEKLEGSYDIIFMDISMPVMDGFDATRSIRALEKQRGIDSPTSTIIALTGLSGSNDELEALGAGMDLFLTKPVTMKNVSKILDQWQRGLQDP
ncbi:uncharacterized protein N7506_009852 [Penicillium brevicompactum]|uniref:uncharacterized protein n=1 Tax=Penicillium brevicompactum TaxID=5074 RepID=UPI002540423D|nr:uncharacterized protein N7506_009852 [Penicillium brevicompactum]KAJ5326750.1 hypothetical protein N7506_009852 [Penicillium brevicompactum]